jgi:transcriptional regulator with XRE-family HTH domain
LSPVNEKVGARVRQRRIESQLSEEAVARVLEMSVVELRDAEAGRIRFSPTHIVALCTVLRVVPTWFFEGLAD